MNSENTKKKNIKLNYKYRNVQYCPRYNKVKKGTFTSPGVWLKPVSHCPRCSTNQDYTVDKKQLKITRYLKKYHPIIRKKQIASESYDADVEMESLSQDKENIQTSESDSKPIPKSKNEKLDIELLSILLERLDTKPTQRYNLRKRKTKSKVSPTKLTECGKKSQGRKHKDKNYLEVDFTMMFEKMGI